MQLKNTILKKKRHNTFIKALVAIVIFITVSNAQLFNDPILIDGLKKGFNFQFNEADNLFDKYSGSFPNSLKGEFLKTKLKLWKFVGSKSPEAYIKFSKSVENLIQSLDTKLDEDQDNVLLQYMIASCYSSKTIALSANFEIVDAFWAAKKAMSYLEDLIEEYPDLIEPHLELGILTYALSYVEGVATLALTLSGMEADRELGLEMLLKANKGNIYAKVESSFYLSQVLSEYIADYQGAIKYLLPIAEKFPGNILFSFQLAVLYSKNFQFEQSEKLIENILSKKESVFPQTTAFSNFLMGDLYFKKGDYKIALNYFNEFLVSSNDINFSSKAYYYIALCHMFLGNEYEIQKSLASTNLGNLENADDKFARRRSQLLQLNKLNPDLVNLIKAEVEFQSGNYAKSRGFLEKINQTKLTQSFLRLFALLEIEILLENKNYKDFYPKAFKLLNVDIENELWIIPKTNLLIARMYYELKNYDKCAEFLEEAEDENEYDFRSEIAGLINKFKRKLRIRNYM